MYLNEQTKILDSLRSGSCPGVSRSPLGSGPLPAGAITQNLTTGVVKTDRTDHFPIFLTSETTVDIYENTTSILKRNINETTINQFKYQLNEVNWNSIYEKKVQQIMLTIHFLKRFQHFTMKYSH